MLERNEQPVVSTEYGIVTDKRVRYCSRKSWFSGGAEEDIPIRHITSVRLETSRHVPRVVLLAVMSLLLFYIGGLGLVIGLIFLLISMFMLWGSPVIIINTTGGDRRSASGFPWTKDAAKAFVGALRTQLFAQDHMAD